MRMNGEMTEIENFPAGFGGWSANFQQVAVVQASDQLDNVKQKKQCDAYLGWLNSQLKKKSESLVVKDLQSGLSDGTALADLIEIVAGEPIEGIVTIKPISYGDKIENVRKVIKFMSDRQIRMHPIPPEDIVSGNLKSVMRLILAVAARFKPNSVKQANQRSGAFHQMSVIDCAQSAADALADARRDAMAVCPKPKKPKPMEISPITSPVTSCSNQKPISTIRRSAALSKSSSQDFSSGQGQQSDLQRLYRELCDTYEHLLKEHEVQTNDYRHVQSVCDDLRDELKNLKSTVLVLHELLIGGGQGLDENATNSTEPYEAEDFTILKSKLLHSEITLKDTKVEMSKTKNNCMRLEGAEVGLQQRLHEQQTCLLNMQTELTRSNYENRTLSSAKLDLEKKLAVQENCVEDLKKELLCKDCELRDIKVAYKIYQDEKEKLAKNLQNQVQDLHQRLKEVNSSEHSLSAKLASQERKMTQLECKILQTGQPDNSQGYLGSDDFRLVRESLRQLRSFFTVDDQRNETVDLLEESIVSLIERLGLDQPSSSQSQVDLNRRMNTNPANCPADNSRSLPNTPSQHRGHSYPKSDPSTAIHSNGHGAITTKVIYYYGSNEGPYVCYANKRLKEITLRDVRKLFGKKGKYRFHFKAHDSEFGYVKEEVCQDDACVPSFEGVVLVWIEDDKDQKFDI